MSGDALNALKEDSTKLGIVIFYILLFGKNFAIQYFFLLMCSGKVVLGRRKVRE